MLGGIYALVAVAFTLTIGVLNFLNFTIPTIFMLAGMSAWAATRAGIDWIGALAIGLCVAVLASLLVERFTYRYLKTRYGDATEHALPLVSSLGFLIVFENLVLIAWGSDPRSFPTGLTNADLRMGELIIGIPHMVSLLLAIGLVWGLTRLLKATRLGRALRSIAENPDAATLMGVDVLRIVPMVFIISGVLTGLAGLLFTVNYATVTPFMGEHVGTKAIAAMVIGGLGNVWGAIAGGLLVGLAEVLSIHFFGADTVKITVWGFLLAVLLIRPTGLFGQVTIGNGKF